MPVKPLFEMEMQCQKKPTRLKIIFLIIAVPLLSINLQILPHISNINIIIQPNFQPLISVTIRNEKSVRFRIGYGPGFIMFNREA